MDLSHKQKIVKKKCVVREIVPVVVELSRPVIIKLRDELCLGYQMNVIHEHCEKASFKDYLVNFGNQTLTLTSTYEPLSIGESNNDESAFPQTDMVLRNFSIMSILFSANHGCVVGKYLYLYW